MHLKRVILQLLDDNGWVLQRTTGSHNIFSKSGRTPIVVSIHGSDVQTSLKFILRDLWLREEEYAERRAADEQGRVVAAAAAEAPPIRDPNKPRMTWRKEERRLYEWVDAKPAQLASLDERDLEEMHAELGRQRAVEEDARAELELVVRSRHEEALRDLEEGRSETARTALERLRDEHLRPGGKVNERLPEAFVQEIEISLFLAIKQQAQDTLGPQFIDTMTTSTGMTPEDNPLACSKFLDALVKQHRKLVQQAFHELAGIDQRYWRRTSVERMGLWEQLVEELLGDLHLSLMLLSQFEIRIDTALARFFDPQKKPLPLCVSEIIPGIDKTVIEPGIVDIKSDAVDTDNEWQNLARARENFNAIFFDTFKFVVDLMDANQLSKQIVRNQFFLLFAIKADDIGLFVWMNAAFNVNEETSRETDNYVGRFVDLWKPAAHGSAKDMANDLVANAESFYIRDNTTPFRAASVASPDILRDLVDDYLEPTVNSFVLLQALANPYRLARKHFGLCRGSNSFNTVSFVCKFEGEMCAGFVETSNLCGLLICQGEDFLCPRVHSDSGKLEKTVVAFLEALEVFAEGVGEKRYSWEDRCTVFVAQTGIDLLALLLFWWQTEMASTEVFAIVEAAVGGSQKHAHQTQALKNTPDFLLFRRRSTNLLGWLSRLLICLERIRPYVHLRRPDARVRVESFRGRFRAVRLVNGNEQQRRWERHLTDPAEMDLVYLTLAHWLLPTVAFSIQNYCAMAGPVVRSGAGVFTELMFRSVRILSANTAWPLFSQEDERMITDRNSSTSQVAAQLEKAFGAGFSTTPVDPTLYDSRNRLMSAYHFHRTVIKVGIRALVSFPGSDLVTARRQVVPGCENADNDARFLLDRARSIVKRFDISGPGDAKLRPDEELFALVWNSTCALMHNRDEVLSRARQRVPKRVVERLLKLLEMLDNSDDFHKTTTTAAAACNRLRTELGEAMRVLEGSIPAKDPFWAYKTMNTASEQIAEAVCKRTKELLVPYWSDTRMDIVLTAARELQDCASKLTQQLRSVLGFLLELGEDSGGQERRAAAGVQRQVGDWRTLTEVVLKDLSPCNPVCTASEGVGGAHVVGDHGKGDERGGGASVDASGDLPTLPSGAGEKEIEDLIVQLRQLGVSWAHVAKTVELSVHKCKRIVNKASGQS